MVVALLGTRPATRPPALLTALVLLLVAADAIRLGVAQLRASASPPTGDKHQIRKLFKTARLHIRRNQLDEARPLLRRCLQIDGADAHSWLALATLEERSGDVEGAKRVGYPPRLLNVSRVVDLPDALCSLAPEATRECLRAAALRGAALTSPQYSAMELVAGLCELAAVCTNRTGRRHAAVPPKIDI